MRRGVLAGLFAASFVGLLTGCGFELRRAPELSFQTLYVTGFRPESSLSAELRRQVAGSTSTRVVESLAAAQAVFEVLDEGRDRVVVASGSAGQVREVQLRTRLRFLLRTPDGRSLIAPTDLLLVRDMSFNERDALAKEYEEDQLYRGMNSDIAAQILRRLATVKLPPPDAPAAAASAASAPR